MRQRFQQPKQLHSRRRGTRQPRQSLPAIDANHNIGQEREVKSDVEALQQTQGKDTELALELA